MEISNPIAAQYVVNQTTPPRASEQANRGNAGKSSLQSANDNKTFNLEREHNTSVLRDSDDRQSTSLPVSPSSNSDNDNERYKQNASTTLPSILSKPSGLSNRQTSQETTAVEVNSKKESFQQLPKSIQLYQQNSYISADNSSIIDFKV